MRRKIKMLAVFILLLTALCCNAARENAFKFDDLPDRAILQIREQLAPPKDARLQFHAISGLERRFLAFVQTSQKDLDALQVFRKERAAVRWLSSFSCTPVTHQPVMSAPLWHSGLVSSLQEDISFFSGVRESFQVEFGWSNDTMRILPTLLGARWLWESAPTLFSISHRSWSVLDAAKLAMLIDLRSNMHKLADKETPVSMLPVCVGRPPQWVVPDDSYLGRWRDARLVDKMLLAMARNAPRLAIERLHVALHDYDARHFVRATLATLADGRLRRVLSSARFKMLATSLLSAQFLWDVSISWDIPQADSATVQHVEAMATALTESPMVRRLAITRTCLGKAQHSINGPPAAAYIAKALAESPLVQRLSMSRTSHGHAQNIPTDPLAAFTRMASAGRTWPTIKTLSLTTHHYGKDLCPPSISDFEALPTLTKRMPALQLVHLESRRKHATHLYEKLQIPILEDIFPLVPPHVTVTFADSHFGIAGVANASSLGRPGEPVLEGYAVVAYGNTVTSGPPMPLMELVGHKLLLNTRALTLIPGTRLYHSTLGEQQSFGWFALRMPKLERLAIDSRWTRSSSNYQLIALPPIVWPTLRALLVHTIDFCDYEAFAAVKALTSILQEGYHISVVDLGIELPQSISDAHRDVIGNLTGTLSGMLRLEHLTLTLTSSSPIEDIRALGDFVRSVLPDARIITVSKQPKVRSTDPYSVDETSDDDDGGLDPIAAVPLAPAFPWPRQFFGGL